MTLRIDLLLALLLGTMVLHARTIEGRVSIAPADRPAVRTLLSDGHGFAVTDNDGRYRLELHPDAATVYVHQSSGYRAEPFYRFLKPEQSHYDFTLTEIPDDGTSTADVIVIGDPETADVGYMDEIAADIARHPEVDFVFIAGDINGRAGMEAHRAGLTPETFPRPVYYAIGNHDIVKRNPGEADCFAERIAPWYYSFEIKGILFISAPMYASWGAPLPYDMKDYGDWLQELLRRFPKDQPKVMLTHDIVDLIGIEVPARRQPVRLDDYNFRSILYGHKHANFILRHDSGRKSYCTATTTRGGIGFTAPMYRKVTFASDGGTSSSLHYTQLKQLLNAGCDGAWLWAVAGNSGDEVREVKAIGPDGSSVALKRQNTLSWTAPVPSPGWRPVRVAAVTESGRTFAGEAVDSGLRLLNALPQETAMADLRIDGDTLFVAVTDDAEAEQGGVYALNRHSGAIRWFYRTRYSVRNNMVQDADNLYLIDVRGNIHAVAKTDGSARWVNSADPHLLSPSASGVALADGIVIGGYGDLLRGIDAVTGKTIWRNQVWTERTPGEDKLAVGGNTVYVISQLNGLYAHDIRTGAVRWQHKQSFLSGTVCIGDGVLFIKGENELVKLNTDDGTRLASQALPGLKSASAPVLWQDLVIFGTAARGVVALHQKDLSPAWSFLPGSAVIATTYYAEGKPHTVDATPLADGNILWVGAGDGCLYGLAAESGKELIRHCAGAPISGQGAMAEDGKKYFTDMAGRVFEWN